MRTTEDDLRELRDRVARLERQLRRMTPAKTDSHDDGVGIVTVAAQPGQYFQLAPATIQGNETAGTQPTITQDGGAFPVQALCLGPNSPTVGTAVCYSTSPEGRIVFNF